MAAIFCENCSAEINAVADRKMIPLDREKNGSSILFDGLVCPHCGKKYAIIIHDRKTDEWIDEAKFNPEKRDELREKVMKRQAELKKRYGFE